MKKLLYLFGVALSFIVASCNNTDETTLDPNAKEECLIKIATNQVEDITNGLLGIQIYTVSDGVETPYANGLFDEWSRLEFKGCTNTTYKVVATLVVDGANILYKENSIYGRPFEIASDNEFNYNESELSALSKSTAQLAGGTMSTIPNVDRYYGESNKLISKSDLIITTPMKRVTFGVKATGELADGETVVIKIAGAPEVELAKDEIEIFTLQYIKEAYLSNEISEVYSENINSEVLRHGVSIFSDNIVYKRNKLSVLTVEKLGISVGFDFENPFEDDEPTTPDEEPIAYITKVLDYVPTPGQFTNALPKYEDGDTQETMNQKVLDAIGNNKKGMITLGNYGGYLIVGFNHTIENKAGKLDFRILGNAFHSAENLDEYGFPGGSCEPGIIMVAVDANENGLADDAWYEIQGSAHIDHTKELWYDKAAEAGNDVNFYNGDYTITYSKPDASFDEDTPSAAWKNYIPWTDNKGDSGYVSKNGFHKQPYFPQWLSSETLSFTGSRLPQNGIDEAGNGSYYVLYQFRYGYADNALDEENISGIDISWAVDADGNPANLDGVDFIKIYGGVMQLNGALGECSTEICGVTDLHITHEDIDSSMLNHN